MAGRRRRADDGNAGSVSDIDGPVAGNASITETAVEPPTGASASADASASGDTATGNTASVAGAEQPKQKRRYTRRATAQATKVPTVEFVSGILVSSHAMLAGLTKFDELRIEEQEGKALGGAAVEVMKLYPGTEISEKAVAWSNLLFIAGMVYGPRFVAVRTRLTREAAEKRSTSQAAPMPETRMNGSGDAPMGGFGETVFDPADLATKRRQPFRQ